MPKLSRRTALWGAVLTVIIATSSLIGGGYVPAVSQALNGHVTAGFRIGITSSNPQGCIPASGQDCQVSYVPPTGTYTKFAVGTGFSYTFTNNQTDMLFEPSGTISAGTITLGPTPADGAMECFFSTQTISSLTLNANAGQTLNNAVSSLSANARNCYLYSLGNTSWDRAN